MSVVRLDVIVNEAHQVSFITSITITNTKSFNEDL